MRSMRVLQGLRVGVVLGFPRLGRDGIDVDAAHHQNALRQILNRLLGFHVVRFRLHRFADAAADHGQGRACFREREVTGHRFPVTARP